MFYVMIFLLVSGDFMIFQESLDFFQSRGSQGSRGSWSSQAEARLHRNGAARSNGAAEGAQRAWDDPWNVQATGSHGEQEPRSRRRTGGTFGGDEQVVDITKELQYGLHTKKLLYCKWLD